MIPKETVDLITATARVEEVISDFVTLKKRGVNLIGHCPFHDEKTPSFTVSPSKGIYKCFGCGKAGNAVNFIMDHEKYSYPEALKYLAKKYNITVEETFAETSPEEAARNDEALKERESLFIVTSFANEFFKNNLLNTDEGKAIGATYFEERGFTKETIKKFELGYSPDAWDAFTSHAMQNGYQLNYLEKTGLTIVNENKKYDRFRGRVIFPIHNLSNKVIGFGGRILKTDSKGAKYINSPESDIYHKSKVLYGLNFARKEITSEDNCFLVEGYTDVISMHQSGIENVVASSGTALTPDQIKLIKRYTQNITVIYDGDPAGIKASLRGIDLILEEGMNVKIILLPEGEDPDSMARNSSSRNFKDYINTHTNDFVLFKTELLLKEAKGDPLKKAQLIKEIVETVAKVQDTILANLYIKECAALMDVSEPVLFTELNKIKRKRIKKETGETAYEDLTLPTEAQQPELPEPLINNTIYEEKEALRLLLNYGNMKWRDEAGEESEDLKVADIIIDELTIEEIRFNEESYILLFNLIKEYYELNRFIDDKYFTSHENEVIRNLSIDLLTNNYSLSDNWTTLHHIVVPLESDLIFRAVSDNLNRLKLKVVEQRLANLEKELKNSPAETEINSLLEQYQLLNTVKIELSKMLTRVIIK